MRELPITLPSLAIAVVKVPERMSEMDFSTLVNTINAWKQALVAPIEDDGQDPAAAAEE